MKKSIRIMALVMAVLMVTLVLASCGTKLSGEYVGTGLLSGVTYKFSGSKVTVSINAVVTTVTLEGKYSIKDDKITFTFEGNSDDATKYGGEHTFKKVDGGITIDGVTYNKK